MFCSILFRQPDTEKLSSREPECFRDLNLDQYISNIINKEKISDISSLYYSPLNNAENIRWRQEILKDLLFNDNLKTLDDFSREICSLSEYSRNAGADLSSGDPWRCNYLLFGHILDYSERYCRCLCGFQQKLPEMEFKSEGLCLISEAITELISSDFFNRLKSSQESVRSDFNAQQYCMLIKNGTVRVKKYEGEENLSLRISSAFEKFGAEGSRDYRQKLTETPCADHVEAGVLQCLSHIYPELFEKLRSYVSEFTDFVDTELLKFCKEIRFYISWLNEIKNMKLWGLPFCFPNFNSGRLYCDSFFDITLAQKMGSKIVKNDFYLDAPERIFVISGPNQGGKTTFARALGQLHYLASLGLCIPGTSANLMAADKVLTHFEREEALTMLSGKLQDDLQRLHKVLNEATSSSLIIINEIFASTVIDDALKMGRYMLEALVGKGALCVIVSFLDELARFGPETVSLMSTVEPDNPSVRSFKIIRKPPDGRAYAMTLAVQHGLSYKQILRRIDHEA